ncbi:ureidoglycolate hydrolase [Hydrogenispora ethanolica]|jgi:ureidoglycolate hydrolase|uniref:Ureidoglycolate hydrolase n=1 Tax=Hydrogenispora ethanolica TaxID=1082276 RepID=A0A4R1S3R4_HYDET|nr:ureidoglycolate lyase [Hydrogenispora ethanolica]TCL73290.1 ureidoglycolate hydrolase [Hydrogenispora ethanolica]
MPHIEVEVLGANFSDYGSYLNPADCGPALGGDAGAVRFYPDRMLGLFEHSNMAAVSVLRLEPRQWAITASEMHRHTEEIIGGFTRDVVFHVAPAGAMTPDLSQMRVFRLPAGWWVRVKRGVWHEAPFVVGAEATVGTVILPPATYTHDCRVVRLAEPVMIEHP